MNADQIVSKYDRLGILIQKTVINVGGINKITLSTDINGKRFEITEIDAKTSRKMQLFDQKLEEYIKERGVSPK